MPVLARSARRSGVVKAVAPGLPYAIRLFQYPEVRLLETAQHSGVVGDFSLYHHQGNVALEDGDLLGLRQPGGQEERRQDSFHALMVLPFDCYCYWVC